MEHWYKNRKGILTIEGPKVSPSSSLGEFLARGTIIKEAFTMMGTRFYLAHPDFRELAKGEEIPEYAITYDASQKGLPIVVAEKRGNTPNPVVDTKLEPSAPTAIDTILSERGSRYGTFVDHARITQDIKAVMKASPKWPDLTDSAREALEMVAHKIGRILNGDPTYLDSWVDIVGYVQLEIDRLNGKIR